MGVTEEIFRLRYQAVGQQEITTAQVKLAHLGGNVKNLRLLMEHGKISADLYAKAMAHLARETTKAEAVVARWEARRQRIGQMGAPVSPGGGGGASRAERSGARARTGFALANIAQDAAYGPTAIINNLIQPQVWKDLAVSIGGGGKALAGFGTVAVAVGAGLMVINNGLKQANLGWRDLDNVVGELAPMRAAQNAFHNLGQEIRGLIGDDLIGAGNTLAGDLAEYTLGWRTATEAVTEHKAALAQAVKFDAGFAGAKAKFDGIDPEQKKVGEAFMNELAGLKTNQNIGAFDAMKTAMMRNPVPGNDDIFAKAAQGDPNAMAKMLGLANAAGLNTIGLKGMLGGVPEQPMDAAVAEHRKGQFDGFGLDAEVENYKLRSATFAAARDSAIGKVTLASERVDAGLSRRIGEGMGLDEAAKAVQVGLAKSLEAGLGDDAGPAAEAFVKERLKRMREGAAAREMADPGGLQRAMAGNQLAMMRMNMAGMNMAGPQTIGGSDFARTVQDGQRSQGEKMIELMEKQLAGLDLEREQVRLLQQIGLVR